MNRDRRNARTFRERGFGNSDKLFEPIVTMSRLA